MSDVRLGGSPRRDHYTRALLEHYCAQEATSVLTLPVPAVVLDDAPLPPRFAAVALPDWAADLGVGEASGGLLVPAAAVWPGDGPEWRRTAWFDAAAWYLHGVAERAYEARHGSIHSYRLRLSGWDSRHWQRAWANRIVLFLRRWAAREQGVGEESLFGPLPTGQIRLTHDVDAITKTWAIRFKQTAFHLFNATRALRSGRPAQSLYRVGRALRFLFGHDDYRRLPELAELVGGQGLTGTLFLHGGRGGGWKRWLFDPAYDAGSPALTGPVRTLVAAGWSVGLHPSFLHWRDPAMLAAERKRVEDALGLPIAECRQHWLRFSWEETWRSQAEAGLSVDHTLGFNDTPGFRNGGALRLRPWDDATGKPLVLESVPLVLMDSHLFDYETLDESGRFRAINRWVGEIRAVHGVADVLWHPHTLAPDYGWRDGFKALLAAVAVGSPVQSIPSGP